MPFCRLVRFAVLAVALVSGTGALAAPTMYGTYYDETPGVLNCNTGANFCRLYFSQLPSNKLVMARKLHCEITTRSPLIQARLEVAATSGGDALPRYVQLPIPPAITAQSNGYYYNSVEIETQWLMGQSRFPLVEVVTYAFSSIFVDCTLIGELIDPIQ